MPKEANWDEKKRKKKRKWRALRKFRLKTSEMNFLIREVRIKEFKIKIAGMNSNVNKSTPFYIRQLPPFQYISVQMILGLIFHSNIVAINR